MDKEKKLSVNLDFSNLSNQRKKDLKIICIILFVIFALPLFISLMGENSGGEDSKVSSQEKQQNSTDNFIEHCNFNGTDMEYSDKYYYESKYSAELECNEVCDVPEKYDASFVVGEYKSDGSYFLTYCSCFCEGN